MKNYSAHTLTSEFYDDAVKHAEFDGRFTYTLKS